MFELILDAEDTARGDTIAGKADAGDTFAQQLAVWNADTDKANYDWIYVQMGANNIDDVKTLTTLKAECAALIDQINTDRKAGSVLIMGTVTPYYSQMETVWGVGAPADAAEALRVGLNNAILANEFGADYVINSYEYLLGEDGDRKTLAAVYDTDGIHPNALGRQLNADEVRTLLNNLGFLATLDILQDLSPYTQYDIASNLFISDAYYDNGSYINYDGTGDIGIIIQDNATYPASVGDYFYVKCTGTGSLNIEVWGGGDPITLTAATGLLPLTGNRQVKVTNVGVDEWYVDGMIASTDGGGISNIVEDTTPQLGGDLDLNGNVIIGLEIGTDIQSLLVSGTNIKTINSTSLLGSGDIVISGSGDGLTTSRKQITSKGVTIGDSTIADFAGNTGLITLMLTTEDTDRGDTATEDASAGDTIDEQLAIWNADVEKANYDWIYVQVGHNDVTNVSVHATVKADYQALIDQINTDRKAGSVLIISVLTPCYSRYVTLYGAGSGADAAQANHDLLNADILSNEFGADYVMNSHRYLLGDSSDRDTLAAAYDSGDGIHPNNTGRQINADELRKFLNNLGFLAVTQPTLDADPYVVTDRSSNFFITDPFIYYGSYINNVETSSIDVILQGPATITVPIGTSFKVTSSGSGGIGVTGWGGDGTVVVSETGVLPCPQYGVRTVRKVDTNTWRVSY
jgi:lysophospholipase L1-like esterase